MTRERRELEEWVLRRDPDAFRALVRRYAGMLHATCRRILRNDADAEEITQECFEILAEARQLPRTEFPGAWLHGVAWNRSRARLRSEIRRAEREAVFAIEQPQHASTQWNDVYAYVDEAIAELPEELRAPLLAQYFEGKSHHAIARALRVPRRTVSHRIERGVQLVGAALERHGIVLGVPVLAALLKANLAEAAVLPVKLAAGLGRLKLAQEGARLHAAAAAGWGATGMKVAVAAVVIALGIAGVWVVKPGSVKTPVNADTKPAEVVNAAAPVGETSARPAYESVAAPLSAAATDAATEEDEQGDALRVIQVVYGDGSPALGAAVKWTAAAEREFPRSVQSVVTGVTDDRGEVVFDHLPEYPNQILLAAAGDYTGIARHSKTLLYQHLRVVLTKAAMYAGTVKDAAGTPVADAEFIVAAGSPEKPGRQYSGARVGKSDAAGSFSIPLPAGFRWQFLVKKEGAGSLLTGFLSAEKAHELRLENATIGGKVTRADARQPIAGIGVVAYARDLPDDRFRCLSTETGEFELTGLRQVEYVLSAEDEFLVADAEMTVRAGEPAEAVAIAVVEGASVSGRVYIGDSGDAVVDFPVSLVRKADRTRRRAVTDPRGAYTFSGLSAGSYTLSTRKGMGYGAKHEVEEQQVEVEAGEVLDNADFPLLNQWGLRAPVDGKVVDAEGKGVPGAIVLAYSMMIPQYQYGMARTGADGAFHVSGLGISRELRLVAYAPRQVSKEAGPLVLVAEGLRNVVLTLEPAGSITGKLTTASGKPFSVEDTRLDLNNAWPPLVTGGTYFEMLPGGHFHFPDLAAGSYEIYLDLPLYRNRSGLRTPELTVELAAGERLDKLSIPFDDAAYTAAVDRENDPAEQQRQEEEYEARNQRSWGIRGQVVDAVTGGTIKAFYVGTPAMSSMNETTHEQGNFELYKSDAKRTRLRVEAKGYVPFEEEVWQEQAVEGFATITCRLQRGPVIDGIVVDMAGAPVPGARVYPEELPQDHEAQHPRFPLTGKDGMFRLDCLEPKLQRIYVEHPGFAIASVEVRPATARTNNLSIMLSAGATVEGVVRMGKKPLSDVRVGYYTEGYNQRQMSVQTDADGKYRVERLTPGLLKFNVQPKRTDPKAFLVHMQRREISVAEGETGKLDFSFGEENSRIRGLVKVNGAIPKHVSVRGSVDTGTGVEDVELKYLGEGAYESLPLPAGKVKLRFDARLESGSSVNGEVEVTLGANQELTQDMELGGGGSVEGFVSGLIDDERISVVAIPGEAGPPELPDNSNEWVREATVRTNPDEAGHFRLEALAPGTYTVRAVSHELFDADETERRVRESVVQVGGEETVKLDFDFE